MSLPKQPKKPTNRPGLSQIAYRIGDYNSFRERLLSHLGLYLPELKTRDPQEIAIALADAWAVVADVLSFYQERIANEGYLLTATERRSVLELARAIGYELKPGVAASTYLAFMVEDTPDGVREVIVPQEAQVMSVPNEGESPQIFETSEEIVARVDWNRLTPRQGRNHRITNNTQQLYLEGIATQLQPGDSILLLDRNELEVARYLLTLTDVVAVPEAEHTIVSWKPLLKLDTPLSQPEVFAFRQQAALFGNLAPDWLADVPDETKRTSNATLKGGVFQTKDQGDRWLPLNEGLPNADIFCLVVNQSNDFFAGTTGSGIFRSSDRGENWTEIIAGLTNLTVRTLYVDWERGYILAGTPGGGVFRSTDNGENWSSIGDGTIRVETSGQGENQSVDTVNTSLPDTVVHSLVTCSTPIRQGSGRIFNHATEEKRLAGSGTKFNTELNLGNIITTVDGQVRTVTELYNDTSLTIDYSFNPSLPTNGAAFSIGGTYIFAGTETGIYRSSDQGKNWYLKGLSNRVIRSLLVSYRSTNQGTGTITSEDTTVTGDETKFLTELQVGDRIFANDQIRIIVAIASDTELTIDSAFTPALDSVGYKIFFSVSQAPGTISSDNTTVTGIDTKFLSESQIGDSILVGDQIKIITAIASDTELTIDSAFNSALDSVGYKILFSVSQGQGTISSDNTTVTGAGTNFKKEFQIGDLIIAEDQLKTIATIPEENQLTINEAFEANLPAETVFSVPKRSPGTISSDSTMVTGIDTKFLSESQIGDSIIVGDQIKIITAIASDTKLTINTAFRDNLSDETPYWILPVGKIHIFAGTDDGIFRSSDYGETWIPVNNSLSNKNVTSLATDFRVGTGTISSSNTTISGSGKNFINELKQGDTIVAAGQTRVVTDFDGSNNFTVDTVFAPVLAEGTTFAIANRTAIFAGTADGEIFRSSNNGRVWESVNNKDLSNLKITSLVADASLGTGKITSNGNQVNGNGTLFAQELRVGDSITAWGETRIITGIDADNRKTELSIDRAFSPDLPTAETNFIINNLFAGTVDGGVFRSVDHGENWSEINGDVAAINPTRGLATQEITSLAIRRLDSSEYQQNGVIPKQGTLLAGTRFSGFVEQEWPGFQLTSQKIDLDTLYTGILEDSWFVLLDGDRFEAFQVDRVADGSRRDFLLDTTITSIIPTAPISTPSNFRRRNTQVLLQGEQLAMAQESLSISSQQRNIFRDPISTSDKSIFLSEFVQGLKSGQALIFAGKHPRAKVKLGGMARSQNWNRTQTSIELGERKIQALKLIPGRDLVYLVVGTDDGVDIFSTQDQGLTWQSLNQGLSNQNVTSLIITSEQGIGTIIANGTEIVGQKNTEFFKQLQPGDLISVRDQARTVSNINVDEQNIVNEKLTIDNPFSISVKGEKFEIKKLLVGTDQGIFRFHFGNQQWEQANQQELQNIQTLAIKEMDNSVRLFAGTKEQGVQLSDNFGQNFSEFNGLTNQNISSLVVNPNNEQILAGTASSGIFRSTDNGNDWQQIAYTKPGTGTISSTGTIVKGNRTAFGRELKPGNLIIAAGQTRVVTELDSTTPDIQLTINTAFNFDLPARTTFDISTGLTDLSISELGIYSQPDKETVSISSTGITVTGTGTSFLESLSSGDIILANNQIRTVNQIISDTQLTIDSPFSNSLNKTAFLTPPRSRGTISSDRNIIRGQNTVFTEELKVGDKIIIRNQSAIVTSITSNVICTIDKPFDPKITSLEPKIEYFDIEHQGIIKRGRGSILDGVVIGTGTNFTRELRAGDVIIAAEQITIVEAVFSATEIAINSFFETDLPKGTPYFVPCRGQGKISSTGTTVTGDENTTFTSELQKNDVVIAAGKIRTINAFDLTINTGFEPDLPPETVFFIPRQGQGTIQSNGTTVTGDEATAFTTELEEGDIILAANQIRTVNALRLVIDTAFGEEGLTDTPFSFFSRTILFASTTNGGIFRSYNNGKHWSAINTGLTDLEIRSLEVHPNKGYLFAGTANGHLFRSTNLGNSWNPIDVGLNSQSIEAIVLANDAQQIPEEKLPPDILFAGVGNTIFRSLNSGRNWQDNHWQRINQGLTFLTVQAIAIHREQSRRYLFAGTRSGVFSSTDGGQHWQPSNDGLTNLDVQALLGLSSSFQLFAGTKEGLFRSTDYGQHWNAVDIGIALAEIRALAFNPTNKMLFVATLNDGVIRYDLDSDRSIPLGLSDAYLQEMVINPGNGYIFVGTNSRGIFRSSTQGNSWQQLTLTRPGKGKIISDGINVTGVATKFNRELRIGDQITVAGQKRTVVTINSETPDTSITIDQPFRPALRSTTNYTIHTGLNNLNVTALAVYLLPGKGTISTNGSTVTGSNTEFLTELKVGDTITVAGQTRTVIEIDSDTEELTVDQAFDKLQPLTGIPFTRDILFAGTAGSGIFCSTNQGESWTEVNTGLENHLEIRCLSVDKYSNRILAGTSLGGVFGSTDLTEKLDISWEPLNTGLTNTDIRAIAIDSTNLFVGGIGILLSQDGFYSTEVQADDWLYVTRPPKDASPGQQWEVKNLDNFVGTLTTLKDGDLTLYPATEEDQTISELGIINIPPNDQQLPVLKLEKPLTNSYDPATVSIYGNIVPATQGETVGEEILGSGEGTVANQRFELQKLPLTYISAPTTSGAASTLKVYVNDVEWQQENSLYPLDQTAQSYIIRLEDDGTTQVIFGDGERGSRLPSGQENIVANYRSGIGIEGNIGAESLTILKTRPLGIEEVTNPLAATGGAERENLAAAQTNAPLTIRTLDRIVSLQDFEDFARNFAGISKAQAVQLWIADRQLVHITVAAAQGKPVEPDSILYQNLLNGINAARDPMPQLQVDSYEKVIFDLEAKIIIDPRYQTEKVLPDIRSALEQKYSFERAEFGQVISSSEIIATIQKRKGVVAVDLDTLHIRGLSKILNQSLIAQKTRWDAQKNQVAPGQLLFLAPNSIKLSQSSNSLEV